MELGTKESSKAMIEMELIFAIMKMVIALKVISSTIKRMVWEFISGKMVLGKKASM